MTCLFPWVLLFATLFTCFSARADGIPPNQASCDGKMIGEACEQGACQAARCSRLDYANWDRDASAGPPGVEYDCTLCRPGAEPQDEDASASVDDDSKDATKNSEAKEDDSKSEATSSSRDDEKGGNGSCAMTPGSVPSRYGPWLLALAFAVLVGPRRRTP